MTAAPYDNCQFRECDLPGQCKGEGKCHHPQVKLYGSALDPVLADAEREKQDELNRMAAEHAK